MLSSRVYARAVPHSDGCTALANLASIMGESSRTLSRESRAVESFMRAAECIGPITRGMSLFAVTRGQWSMIDAILHCLDCVGRSRIVLWTWTVAEYEVQALERLQNDGRVAGATLIIDRGARKKNLGIIRGWRAVFGADSVRYVMNHAKLARIESESGMRLLLRGSMNLNYNPRFEQFDLTEGGPDYDLVRSIDEALPVLSDNAERQEIIAASGVGAAFTSDELAMFDGVLPWAK